MSDEEYVIPELKDGDIIVFTQDPDKDLWDIQLGKWYNYYHPYSDDPHIIDDAGDRNYCLSGEDDYEHFKVKVVGGVYNKEDNLVSVATETVPINLMEGAVQVASDLTTRKNNKNKMELVDTGFPNALLALGEVMTWAALNKGYKVNDWKDLPNPEMSFIGAASRHRNERMAGRERDHESNLLHLAHEAFNVLAQLELKITGKM